MPELKGVAFGYHKPRRTAYAVVDAHLPFQPYRLWKFKDDLNFERQRYCEIRIEDGKLKIEVPGFDGTADDLTEDEFTERVRLIFDQVQDQPQAPIRPITVFRRSGEAALNPSVAITTSQLAQYMRSLSDEHGLDPRWRAKLDDYGYLSVSFDTPKIEVDRYAEVFQPSFEGAGTISIRTYDMPPRMLFFSVTYGGTFGLNFGRAEAQGFINVGRLEGVPPKIMATGYRSTSAGSDALQQDFRRAVVFAQALGCHPVGEVTAEVDRYTRIRRLLGPLGDWVNGMQPER